MIYRKNSENCYRSYLCKYCLSDRVFDLSQQFKGKSGYLYKCNSGLHDNDWLKEEDLVEKGSSLYKILLLEKVCVNE